MKDKKYVRVMDGVISNAGGFEYKINQENVAKMWNPLEKNPEKMCGFNFGTEDKILRWLHRGDTIYDVIIPENGEVVICDEEKGIYRANKIIVTNPRKLTDEIIMELYRNNTLSNKILAQTLKILLWKDKLHISEYIVKDKINKENVDEFLTEFGLYSCNGEFDYSKLEGDTKIIYDQILNMKEN